MNRGMRYLTATAIVLSTAALSLAQSSSSSTSTPGVNLNSGDINSILQQLTGSSTTGTTTGSTGTTTGTGGTSTTTQPASGGFPPLTTGLPQTSVTLGALQARAPGTWIAHARGVSDGTIEIPGNGDDSTPSATAVMREMAFNITQSVVQSVQQGILQLFSSFLSQLGVNIPGGGSFVVPTPTINVNGTLDNQTTTSTGTVVPVP